jgi:hypothetical protein
MTNAQRKARIELYILIILLIIGALLVARIPAQTPKQATPIYVWDNQGVAVPHCAEGYSIKYRVLPADNLKDGYVVYRQPHTEAMCEWQPPSQKKPDPPKDCPKGEYRSMDGRCLYDQTGEVHPTGDGCNSSTCADPSCRLSISTAMACVHGDDPAPVTDHHQPQAQATMQMGFIAKLTDPCGFPAALHKDGRCHQTLYCDKGRATPKLVHGVWTLDCSWNPASHTDTHTHTDHPSPPEPKP